MTDDDRPPVRRIFEITRTYTVTEKARIGAPLHPDFVEDCEKHQGEADTFVKHVLAPKIETWERISGDPKRTAEITYDVLVPEDDQET